MPGLLDTRPFTHPSLHSQSGHPQFVHQRNMNDVLTEMRKKEGKQGLDRFGLGEKKKK
uniref:Uncharacterized protein n=1 Tax=Arundo donax TaxID=35708 RepID=A0A0A9GTZ4_ARUDO